MKEEELFVQMLFGGVPNVSHEGILAQEKRKSELRKKVWPPYQEALGVWWRAHLAKREDALMDSVRVADLHLLDFCIKTGT